jgi:serpin B
MTVALAGCGKAAGPTPPPVEWTPDVQAVADANNRFALDLYGKLREKPGSLFFSPYSVHTALAMAATGAKGNTLDEMVKVLHLPADEGKRLAAGDLGRWYAHPRPDYELAVANALWGQKGFPWRPEFLAVQKDRFGAGFNEADFVSNPDAERQRINKWVEGQTRDRIKDLLKEPHITVDTRMVLANAIYFKGRWAEEFDKKETRDAPFHLADGKTATVPLMHRKIKCKYGVADPKADWGNQVKLAELPYRGDDLSMVLILPPKADGLPAIEKQLTPETLAKWIGAMTPKSDFSVSLPRFTLETEADLPGYLKQLGMVDAFDKDRADFSGMSPEALCVSAVAHKAFVDVNEEGTEAAAATAVMFETVSLPPSFRADRPFLFLIRDVKHGTILFLGRYVGPK